MHAKIRWTAVVLTLLTAVVILSMFGTRDPAIPRKLPAISSEARPLSAATLASVEIYDEPSRFYSADPMPVQFVSHNVPVAVRLPLVLGANEPIVELVQIKDHVDDGSQPQHLIWTDEHWGDNKPIFVRSRDILFTLEFEGDNGVKISVNDAELASPNADEYGHRLDPGKNKLEITAKNDNGQLVTVRPSSLIIHAPDKDRVRAPNITHLANGKNADLTSPPASSESRDLYGTPKVYLRIVGQNYPVSGELSFFRTVGHDARLKL